MAAYYDASNYLIFLLILGSVTLAMQKQKADISLPITCQYVCFYLPLGSFVHVYVNFL